MKKGCDLVKVPETIIEKCKEECKLIIEYEKKEYERLKTDEDFLEKLKSVVTDPHSLIRPINFEERLNRLVEQRISMIKEIFCDFLENGLIQKNLIPKFIELFNNLSDYSAHRRFMASISLYLRMHKEVKHLEDKFIYLCIAVEAAKRFEKGKTGSVTSDFVDFFVENLSNERINMLSEKFEILGPSNLVSCLFPEISDKARVELLFRYLYWKRSNFVHEGKLFKVPLIGPQNREEYLMEYTWLETWRYRASGVNLSLIVECSLDFETLCRVYEEALLNEFSKNLSLASR